MEWLLHTFRGHPELAAEMGVGSDPEITGFASFVGPSSPRVYYSWGPSSTTRSWSPK
ncbi:MAG: hypothetical protein ISS17_03915 [Bacteroidales bacterium]|nr:hypothetical protein [Bacteroidales bacterium]